MLIAIGTFLNRSSLGGILPFIIFSLPSGIILLLYGLLVNYLDNYEIEKLTENHKTLKNHINLTLKGF